MPYVVDGDRVIPVVSRPTAFAGVFVESATPDVLPSYDVANQRIVLSDRVRIVRDGESITLINEWDVVDLTDDEKRYVIPPEVFREQRLTKDERQFIRTLARDSSDIADLWEKLLTLKEGIISDDPLTLIAKQACTQLFGAERAEQLFAPYEN